MTREITCVTVDITTHCDRRCPDCCANIGERPTVHHSWDYFEKLAPFVYGMDRINLTGGEPTVHPRFAEFVPKFKELFGCNRLTLSTDGFRVDRYADVLKHFDGIHASRYGEANRAKIDGLVQLRPDTSVFEGDFIPRSRRGSGGLCFRGLSDTVAYADGKFYGCCVAPGIPTAQGMEPHKDWRQAIVNEPLPCEDCWFSP